MTRVQTLSVALGAIILALALGVAFTHNRPSADVTFNTLGVNGGGSGGGTQSPPTAPGVPGADASGESAATNLTWTWGIATDCSGCAGILAYYLDVGSSAGGSDVVNDAVISGGATSYTHDTLAGQKRTYYATVYAKSTGGTSGASSQSTSNPTIDRQAPTISGVTVGSIGQTEATVTWTTSEAATSQVRYGASSGSYTMSSTESTSRNTNHSVVITDLAVGTTYYLQAKGADQYRNAATSAEVSFATSATASSTTSSSTPTSASLSSPSPSSSESTIAAQSTSSAATPSSATTATTPSTASKTVTTTPSSSGTPLSAATTSTESVTTSAAPASAPLVAGDSAPVPDSTADPDPDPELLIAEADKTQGWLLVLLASIGLIVVLWFAAHRAHAHYTQP